MLFMSLVDAQIKNTGLHDSSPRGWPNARRASGAAAVIALLWAAWIGLPAARPVLALLALAPLAEEIVFRGGVQETLLRLGLQADRANLLTTLAFAAVHGLARSWPLALAVAWPAWWLGRVYARRRRLAPCIAWHAALNALWLLLAQAIAHTLDLPTLLG